MDTDEITRVVIGCAIKVSNALGPGFVEKVYENALAYELHESGLGFQQQATLRVFYRDNVVGEFVADIVVEDAVILELKAAKEIDVVHQAQLLNYLRATGKRIGLILNFGAQRLQIKRMIL
jgi:GxxExxY protein